MTQFEAFSSEAKAQELCSLCISTSVRWMGWKRKRCSATVLRIDATTLAEQRASQTRFRE